VICNLYKGTDFAAFGATNDEIVLLFNPRKHNWWEHFKFDGAEIVGLTPIGIATVMILQFNLSSRNATAGIDERRCLSSASHSSTRY
jgi:hypothetical protein